MLLAQGDVVEAIRAYLCKKDWLYHDQLGLIMDTSLPSARRPSSEKTCLKRYCRTHRRLRLLHRPEMKVERVSYDVMTPSAARACFEPSCGNPPYIGIRCIEVLKPIRWINLRRSSRQRGLRPQRETAMKTAQAFSDSTLRTTASNAPGCFCAT